MKRYKTPLRYPGGKSRAMKILFEDKYMPDNIEEYREGFLGGGSPAIAFTKMYPDVPVWVNDKYYNLYSFWVALRDHGNEMSERLLALKKELGTDVPKHHERFLLEKQLIQEQEDQFEIAWRFFFLNKASFSGLGESSGFSKLACNSNFNESTIEALKYYSSLIKNWKITNGDYSDLLEDKEGSFVFMDPPYDIKDFLYGKDGVMHSSFDHVDFAKKCKESKNKIMVTYNSNEHVRKLFEGWEQIEWDLTYTMNNNSKKYVEEQDKRKELLCLNYKVKERTCIEKFLDGYQYA